MRTWAEAAGVPEAVRKQLGRWTPSVDLSYERTTRSNTLLASVWRGWAMPREPRWRSLNSFGKMMRPKRIRLESPDKAIEEGMSDQDEGWQLIVCQRHQHMRAGSQLTRLMKEDPENQGSTGVAVIPRGSYVISEVGRSKMKTLHRVGECHRVIGVHYNKYEVIGGEQISFIVPLNFVSQEAICLTRASEAKLLMTVMKPARLTQARQSREATVTGTRVP